MPSTEFDHQTAHRHFAANCFNKAWELIDLAERTDEQNREMIRLAQASHWHWTQVSDHTPSHLSVAHWQLARVYCLAGQFAMAQEYGQRCLEISSGLSQFHRAYGHEAIARAALLSGDRELGERHRREAQQLVEAMSNAEERELLTADLQTLPPAVAG